jgi:hypothetical protein
MMQFHDEIKAIHNNWTSGRITKRTAVTEFEQVMSGLGLIPDDQQLDRDMPDVDFAFLLQKAAAVTPEDLRTMEALRAKNQADNMKTFSNGNPAIYFCSACRKAFPHLVTDIRINDNYPVEHWVKLDAPRCEACARRYLDEQLKANSGNSDSMPMSTTELRFFRSYERQMKEFDEDE